jgi:D-alanine-D-alanine ligase
MHVGFTYDLRDDYLAAGFTYEETAEFDRIETIDAIDEALRRNGHRVDRIGNVQALARRLVNGDRWDLVFNIAEGVRGYGREAQVPALLDAYNVPFTFSDPLVMALTLHKGMAKRVVRDQGIPTPDFAVVANIEDVERVRLPFPVFAKPVAEGTGRGVGGNSRVTSKTALRKVVGQLLTAYRQPALIETYLPGREFTVGILGAGAEAKAIGVLEVGFTREAESTAYGFVNKKECDVRVTYTLVDDDEARSAGEWAVAAWRALECRDAGRVDLRSAVDGKPQFMEVNPLAGLNPVESDLPILAQQAGMSYERLIGMIVDAAGQRVVRRSEGRRRLRAVG